MKSGKLFLTAVLLALPVSVFCADWVIPQTTYYLTLEQQEFSAFPVPPEPGSIADRKDLKAVLDWQYRRTEKQCAEARGDAHATFENFFGEASPFPDPLPPEALEIFKRVKSETDGAAAHIKDRFMRKRPFLRDPAIDPCLDRIGGKAYPSGHATISRVFAHMLAELVPKRRKEFFAHADAAALLRVIGGVHHPADIAAGKKLGDLLYAQYAGSKAFSGDMKILRRFVLKDGAKPAVKAGAN